MNNELSPKWSLNSIDWKKIGIGALVAIVGAVLTYSQQVIMKVDFGTWSPIVMIVNSTIVNLVRKFIADNTEQSSGI